MLFQICEFLMTSSKGMTPSLDVDERVGVDPLAALLLARMARARVREAGNVKPKAQPGRYTGLGGSSLAPWDRGPARIR